VDTIVCGIDGSASARRAASFAAHLSDSVGAELVLAHAVPFVLGRTGAELAAPAVDVGELIEAGESLIERTRRDCALPPATRQNVTVGSARAHLLRLSRLEDTRLIVVGMSSRRGVVGGHWGIGPVVAKAACPIVIVMPHHTIRLLITIVCGVDDTDTSARASDAAQNLGDDLGAHIIYAHAVPSEPESQATNASVFQSKPPTVDPRNQSDLRLLTGAPEQALSRLAEEEKAALVVVGSRSRGTLASAVFGSVSAHLPDVAPCPTMIVPRRARRRTTQSGYPPAATNASDRIAG